MTATGSAALDTDRRKRLGQFFTGTRLARVLAALATAQNARTIIDPMGGSGDMLVACRDIGAMPDVLASIEIDPAAATSSTARFRDRDLPLRLVIGSAFDTDSWRALPETWDLVITNPPYVRYQTGSAAGADESLPIPSAAAVRSGLLELIASATHLTSDEQHMYTNCASTYSGLADLAVPAWLVCALRVAAGGRLAMVVPNTWLSRDYAAPVLYILRRFFEIEYVVEDRDMTWFSDALVRTTLVVARRVHDKGSPYEPGRHLRLSLPGVVATDSSLVGKAFPGSAQPESDFSAWAAMQRSKDSPSTAVPVDSWWSDEHDLIHAIRHAARRHEMPVHADSEPLLPGVPERLRELLSTDSHALVNLCDLGWIVGQGLRSGANDFFYVTGSSSGYGMRSPIVSGEELTLPPEVLHPAIRRQADLRRDGPDESRRSFALILDGWALPEDARRAGGPAPWRVMDGDLARLVRAAANVSYERGGKTVRLPELSAVRTNAHEGRMDDPLRRARFWYHLPSLARRHRPALFVARVNSGHPAFHVNTEPPDVIDANFSTIWRTQSAALSSVVLLAVISSSWVIAFLELTGTVLGGGALKVEATHLRRLLVPMLTESDSASLAVIGHRFAMGEHSRADQNEVDRLVAGSLGAADAAVSINALAEEMLRKRSG